MHRNDSASASIPSEPSQAYGEGTAEPHAEWRGTHPHAIGEPVGAESRTEGGAWGEVRSADELTKLLHRIAHPIVVAFENRECDHCRAQRTMLSLAWQQLTWQVTTLRVDGRQLPNVADHYRILGYPTLLVFSAGQVVDRLPGRRDAKSIIHRLSRLTDHTGADKGGLTSAGFRPAEETGAVLKAAR